MVDRPTDLSYGHLGEPFYDRNNQEWRFQRIPGIQSRLRVTGSPTNIVPAAIRHLDHNRAAKERKIQINKLTQIYTDLAPAVNIIAYSSKEPEAAFDSRASHLQSALDLLVFGEIPGQNGGKQVRIAASVSGENGNAVRLISLQEDNSRTPDEGRLHANLQSSRAASQPVWVCGENPIQQLTVSTPEDHKSIFLAVRTHTEVSILRIFFRIRPTDQPLKLEQLAKVPIDSKDMVRPLAVAFNPDDHLQFCILSEKGRWSSWELKPSPLNSLSWIITTVSSGSLFTDRNGLLNEDMPQADQTWGSCLWTQHPKALVLASRHNLHIVQPESNFEPNDLSKKILRDGQDMVVEMKLALGDVGHFVVVTTSCIMVLEIDEHAISSENAESAVSILASWRHFRDIGDLTLRLELFNMRPPPGIRHESKDGVLEGGPIMAVVLYSRSTGIITLYGFRRDLVLPNLVVSTHDPYLLALNLNSPLAVKTSEKRSPIGNRNNQEHSLLGMKMQPSNSNVCPENEKFNVSDSFIMVVLFDDLSVFKYNCTSSRYGDEIDMTSIFSEELSLSAATATEDEMDDFVVPDRQEMTTLQAPPSRDLTGSDVNYNQDDNSQEDPWTLDHRWLVQGLEKHPTSPSEKGMENPLQGLIDLIFTGHGRIGQHDKDDRHRIRSLFEITGGDLGIEDIDLLSERLELLLASSEMQKFGLVDLRVGMPRDENVTLSSTYKQLLRYWMSSLPDDTPMPTRAALVRKVRNIAAEVFLSQTAVNPSTAQKSVSSQRGPGSSQSNRSFELPMHTKVIQASEERRQLRENARDREEFPVLPRMKSPQSSVSIEAPPQKQEQPTVGRLRDFIRCESSKSIPRPLLPMISKWQIGQDLDDYVWADAQAAAVPSEEESVKHIDPRHGEKLNLRQKRQRHRTVGFSSQPASKRSPQIHSQRPMPSSQISDGPITMTQPEVGAHGSRKPVKKGKKPKKPGFR